jgi:hypothetical protein
MERDAAESDAAEMTHRADMSRAFGRGRDRRPLEAMSSTLRFSSGESIRKPADELTTQTQMTPIFVLFCITAITVACVASHAFGFF